MRVDIGNGVRIFVDTDGGRLVPEGPQMKERPTLVMLHGGPGYDHSVLRPAFSALNDVAQVVYYDHRCHGRSDRCDFADCNLATWADDLVRLCGVLGIVKPIVFGQSFGGM